MEAQAGVRFRPRTQEDLAPASSRGRFEANVAVLEILRALDAEDRSPTASEVAALGRWSGWGSLPEVFDERGAGGPEKLRVRELLGERGWRAAARTTLNAHYTDAALVKAIWDSIQSVKVPERRLQMVLEPGCGAGTFIGFAPDQVGNVVGVELDPTTARIAGLLYPRADVRAESFVDTTLPEASQDLVIGNVPFGDITPHDRRYNADRMSLHNYFIHKSLRLVRPGGLVAVLTSRWTLDSRDARAREVFASLADLVSAVRLPNGTHAAAAGTDVVTDLLVFRRRFEQDPSHGWMKFVETQDLPGADVAVNQFFQECAGRVVGTLGARLGRFGPEVCVAPPRTRGVGLAEFVAEEVRRFVSKDLAAYHQVRPLFADRWVAPLDVHAYNKAAAEDPRSGQPTSTGPGSGRPVETQGQPGTNTPRLSANEETPYGDLVELSQRVRLAEDHISVAVGGGFEIVHAGARVAWDVPKSQARELELLIGLRDTMVTLLDLEATAPLVSGAPAETSAEASMSRLRERLNAQYDGYVARFGAINRVVSRKTGRFHPITGEPVVAQVRPRQGGFRVDPHAAAVMALEHYDSASGTARKADIFDRRVVSPRVTRTRADSPADAVALCLDTHGALRTDAVAALLGVSADEAEEALEPFAFVDPDAVRRDGGGWSMSWVPNDEFLSGNVRVRLARTREVLEQLLEVAEHTSDGDRLLIRRLQDAEQALVAVQPEDLGPTEIVAQLGVPWVPVDVVEQFIRELLDDPSVRVEHPGGSVWSVSGARNSVAATNMWGTERVSAIDLLQSCLEQRQIRVTDEVDGGRRVVNETATFAAQEKAEAIQERFTSWLWEEAERCQRLVRLYNDTLNAIVLRRFEVDPNKSYPGMANWLELRDHQRQAVARMVAQPTVLLAHEVGAGKTFSAIAGCMELRRLGVVNKPAVVVPNHMLEQFSREWMQAYPQAQLLICGTEDLVKDKRRLFVAKAAAGAWDAVVLSRSAFEKIPVSTETEVDYADAKLDQTRQWLQAAKDGAGLSTKRLEGALARAEERLKGLRDAPRDPAITFEATGIDYLVVDEAHGYKNLQLSSNIPGVAIDGSQRATDLDLKMNYMRSRFGGRVGTFMTATPIANSVAEAYTMLRFLAPDELDASGLCDFDTWAATFGQVVTELELSASGSGFRMKSRFSKFNNVPELLKLWHTVADVKTAEDLDLPTPNLVGGAPATVVVPATEALSDFMTSLADRADKVASRMVRPEEDNMLRISSHGRAAALDLRLIAHPAERRVDGLGGFLDREPSKVDAVADKVAEIYHQTKDAVYDSDPVPGGLQLVFCDLGTPSGDGWNAYEDLRAQLGARGVPPEKVRFMHEAANDRAKARMFEQARSGHISVLIGSTEKMGVGTNVQRRAVALHHVDCPWRPADLAQRDGRIMRQGNLNDEVQVFRYVTESSFDTYLWQTVERKARFINQLMKGRLDVREIEDIGDAALSYAEVKALASGDPRIMELAKAETEMTKLERLERAWAAAQRSLRATIAAAGPAVEQQHVVSDQIRAALPHRVDTDGDGFSMSVGTEVPRRFSKRSEAAGYIRHVLTGLPQGFGGRFGSVGGLELTATVEVVWGVKNIRVGLSAVPTLRVELDSVDLREGGTGVVTRLENLPRRLERALAESEERAAKVEREAERAREGLQEAFPRAGELAAVRTKRNELSAALAAESEAPATPPSPNGCQGDAVEPATDRAVLRPPAPSAVVADLPHLGEASRGGPVR